MSHHTNSHQHDVFICHASEDKTSVVFPLVACLKAEGISTWVDKAEISWGDSIVERFNHGLKTSKYALIVFSRAFMSKRWPQEELWSALHAQIESGRVRVLPLLVGTPSEVQGILEEFPLLAGKLFVRWNHDPQTVARALAEKVGDDASTLSRLSVQNVQLISCGQCKTPFEKGVHVCLGCQGDVVYGMTFEEKLIWRQVALLVTPFFTHRKHCEI